MDILDVCKVVLVHRLIRDLFSLLVLGGRGRIAIEPLIFDIHARSCRYAPCTFIPYVDDTLHSLT